MNNIKNNNFVKSYHNNRIHTPRETKYNNENGIIIDKKTKSSKKININYKNPISLNNKNNINSINIINNNYNNIYLDINKEKQNKNLIIDDKNLGLLTFGNMKEKSIKKAKALKLIFNQSNKEKFNENKYQYIINRLKYEIEYYKNQNKPKSNKINNNSPQSFKKKGNKNLFLASNNYNTIKTYDNKSNTDTNRKNKNNHLYDAYNNYIKETKLTSDFSYKNNLKINTNKKIDINYVPKSYSNNFISIDSNRTLKFLNKRPKINYTQNNSSRRINKSNNLISNDIIYEDNTNNSEKSSFANLYNHKLYLNKGLSSPLSLKKNIKNINNNFLKHTSKEINNEVDFSKTNYKDKFDNLKKRMNKLLGNLFDIIDLQKNQIDKMKLKETK